MNKKYKYETHMHTAEGSKCASASAREMVRAHIDVGYAGMIVTDHFFNGNTTVPDNLSWKHRVNLLLKGYKNAVKEAKGTGFRVFFAWEYTYFGTDFLTYGLGEDFLLAHPDMLSWSPKEYFDIVHDNGGFISHAHPFREASYIDKLRLFPEYVDAIEVINSSHQDPRFDKKALRFAREHSLIQTAGSDSHHLDSLNGAGMEFDFEIKSIGEFVEAVRAGEHTLVDRQFVTLRESSGM